MTLGGDGGQRTRQRYDNDRLSSPPGSGSSTQERRGGRRLYSTSFAPRAPGHEPPTQLDRSVGRLLALCRRERFPDMEEGSSP